MDECKPLGGGGGSGGIAAQMTAQINGQAGRAPPGQDFSKMDSGRGGMDSGGYYGWGLEYIMPTASCPPLHVSHLGPRVSRMPSYSDCQEDRGSAKMSFIGAKVLEGVPKGVSAASTKVRSAKVTR